MNPEIKQRIEQLNNGELPKGYKKTDFGVFPCDWIADKKLKDIGSFGKGKGLPGNKMMTKGIPCVGYGDIYMKYNHPHFERAQSFVDVETAKESQPIKKGTLLFTGTGETSDEIGKCVCYNGEEEIYAGGDIITYVTDCVNPLFIAYQQYQPFSLKKKASFGQGHSVVHIQKDSLEKLNVAYPSSSQEQSRIVNILMKWDEAIDLYDKQIDALTRYKKICLRKMFPQKGQHVPEWRFHGFSDAWKSQEWSKTVDISNEIVDPKSGLYDELPHVAPGNIEPFSGRLLDNVKLVKEEKLISGKFKFSDGDIIYGKINPQLGKYLFATFSGLTSADAYVLNAKNSIDQKFLFAILQTWDFLKYSVSVSKRSGMPKINREELNAYSYLAPSKTEQVRIGQFLFEFDHLITLYHRKREIIIGQKKTLQQILLNGIVRV